MNCELCGCALTIDKAIFVPVYSDGEWTEICLCAYCAGENEYREHLCEIGDAKAGAIRPFHERPTEGRTADV